MNSEFKNVFDTIHTFMPEGVELSLITGKLIETKAKDGSLMWDIMHSSIFGNFDKDITRIAWLTHCASFDESITISESDRDVITEYLKLYIKEGNNSGKEIGDIFVDKIKGYVLSLDIPMIWVLLVLDPCTGNIKVTGDLPVELESKIILNSLLELSGTSDLETKQLDKWFFDINEQGVYDVYKGYESRSQYGIAYISGILNDISELDISEEEIQQLTLVSVYHAACVDRNRINTIKSIELFRDHNGPSLNDDSLKLLNTLDTTLNGDVLSGLPKTLNKIWKKHERLCNL